MRHAGIRAPHHGGLSPAGAIVSAAGLVHGAQGLVLMHAGVLTAQVVTASLPLAAIAVASLLAGMALRSRLPPDAYRRWLKRVLLVVVVLLIAQFLAGG